MEEKRTEADVPKIIIGYELLLGLFELVSSFGIFFLSSSLMNLYNSLVNKELIEDPNDLTVRLTEKIIPNLFDHRIYIALLLFLFGAIKITSGIGLLYKKVWAEHLLVIFLVVLIPFEFIALIRHFSIPDLAYLGIDVLIVLYLVRLKPVSYFHRLLEDFGAKK